VHSAQRAHALPRTEGWWPRWTRRQTPPAASRTSQACAFGPALGARALTATPSASTVTGQVHHGTPDTITQQQGSRLQRRARARKALQDNSRAESCPSAWYPARGRQPRRHGPHHRRRPDWCRCRQAGHPTADAGRAARRATAQRGSAHTGWGSRVRVRRVGARGRRTRPARNP